MDNNVSHTTPTKTLKKDEKQAIGNSAEEDNALLKDPYKVAKIPMVNVELTQKKSK
eukprot:CAMPEP_0172438100 /NCGR_PEP_ID=MMETSP1064-20121228/72616_1 /TAXON_ID=202472 /ORGANISM="Aulacoseira subarctica , Strain CCAP 1002/5" /LENGTH=55 /DNA_ID=CAMNT_0013186627 /DNA_START=36 /DNA_END=203 /DNA_ORIENTATION=+